MSDKLNEIELFKFNNPIFEIIEIESSKYENEDVYYPPYSDLTMYNWNLRGMVFKIAKTPEKFYKYFTKFDVLVIYEFYMYHLLSNFNGVKRKKWKN